jgi:L-fuconate dehydratase
MVIPAYITSAGWLGYPEKKVRRLCREALAKGWSHFKVKVGAAIELESFRKGDLSSSEPL